MEQNSGQSNSLFNLRIEGATRELLHTIATWARIIAIVGFISAGLSLLDMVIGKKGAAGFAAFTNTITLITLVVTIVFNIFLFRFAKHTLISLSNMSQVQFNEGANNLKTYFKLYGIFIIIALILIILFILANGAGRIFR
jgi:magnesium-transporting ATPase (P-type)